MKKIKIGYLPFYIKLYDDSDPHARDPMVGYMRAVMEMLRTQGLEIVEADEICRVKEEFNRAASKFNDEEVVAVITHHLAYSPSLESIEALLSLKAPLIVLDTTPAYELVKVASYEDRIHQNHGIHGVQDTKQRPSVWWVKISPEWGTSRYLRKGIRKKSVLWSSIYLPRRRRNIFLR